MEHTKKPNQIKLEDFLRTLPKEGSIEYSLATNDYLGSNKPSIENDLKAVIADVAKKELKFNAIYVLCNFYLRYEKISYYNILVQSIEQEYHSRKSYGPLLARYFKNIGAWNDAIEQLKEAATSSDNHQGILHQYASTVASAIENGIEVEASIVDDAFSAIKKALIKDKNYPKYHFTKGKLLAFKGDFRGAKQELIRAIELENVETSDYLIKIGNYKNYMLQIENMQLNLDLKKQIISSEHLMKTEFDRMQQQLKEGAIKNVELLAFFAGVLSLIMGTVNVVSHQNFASASSLLLILAGVLIMSFTMLRIIIQQTLQWKIMITTLFLGVTITLLGFLSFYILSLK